MEYSIKPRGEFTLYVKASGRMDLDSAVQYGTAVKDALYDADEQITELVLDFGEVTFISSFGLKVVLELYKHMQEQNGKLTVENVPEQIKNSFKMVGFDKFLEFQNVKNSQIEDTRNSNFYACVFVDCLRLLWRGFPYENKTAYAAELYLFR